MSMNMIDEDEFFTLFDDSAAPHHGRKPGAITTPVTIPESPLILAYTAGLMDNAQFFFEKPGFKAKTYKSRVRLEMKQEGRDFFVEHWNIDLNVIDVNNYNLNITNSRLYQLIVNIFPYMIMKKNHAQVIKDFHDFFALHPHDLNGQGAIASKMTELTCNGIRRVRGPGKSKKAVNNKNVANEQGFFEF
jgi:hypothetical protein